MTRRWRPRPRLLVSVVLAAAGVVLLGAAAVMHDRPVVAPAGASVLAPVDDATADPSTSDPRAIELVRRAQEAARVTAYAGVKVVSRGDEGTARSVLLDVVHAPGVGTAVRPSGEGGASGRGYTQPVPDPMEDNTALIALVERYRLTTAGAAEVAGRRADQVVVERADGAVAARLWLDQGSGLLLRRELLDRAGRVVLTSGFVQVDLDPDLDRVPPVVPAPWERLSDDDVAALRVQGWPLPATAGPLVLSQVRRDDGTAGAEAPEGAARAAGSGPTVQLVYTDGLTRVSAFVQSGVLDAEALDGYRPVDANGSLVHVRQTGAPVLVWQSGDHVVTVAADSPSAPVAALLAVLPAPRTPDGGAVARVERGVARVTGWLNPIG